MGVRFLDGTVVASSQTEAEEWLDDRSTPLFIGVILSVKPADEKTNYTALNHDDFKGYRHECTVLAADYLGKQPDLLITNVIIPPGRHSGIDNFEEDLPRGCSGMVDDSQYKDSLQKVDYTKLDGEWCVVGFVGGNIENAFIVGWWPHPANTFDPATSGHAYDDKALVQADLNKGKYRFLRRINGTYVVVNKEGTVYLDTTEANSSVRVKDGSLERTLVDKGGHLQVDICHKAQFEINLNEKEHKNARIGAGSNSASPQTDVDLPHTDQPISGAPKPRPTTRTYIRGKEYELLLKTSNFSIFCEDTEEPGDFIVMAHNSITLSQQPDGGTTSTVSMADGVIQIVAADGTQVNVLEDEVQIVTKSGGLINVKGTSITIAGNVDISGPLAVGGPTGQPLVLGTGFTANMATYLAAELANANVNATEFGKLATAAVGPLAPLAAAFGALATSWGTYAAAVTALQTAINQPPASNVFLTKASTSS